MVAVGTAIADCPPHILMCYVDRLSWKNKSGTTSELSIHPSRGWICINLLQHKNPSCVGQGIGGHLEIHAATTEVRCKNRHYAIQSQIAGVRLPVPNCGFPEDRKADGLAWVNAADFSIFENRPVLIAVRMNLRCGRHAR